MQDGEEKNCVALVPGCWAALSSRRQSIGCHGRWAVRVSRLAKLALAEGSTEHDLTRRLLGRSYTEGSCSVTWAELWRKSSFLPKASPGKSRRMVLESRSVEILHFVPLGREIAFPKFCLETVWYLQLEFSRNAKFKLRRSGENSNPISRIPWCALFLVELGCNEHAKFRISM